MTHPQLSALQERLVALSRDYSETPQRLLLVIGTGSPEFADYLRDINACSHTHVADQTLLEAADPSKRFL